MTNTVIDSRPSSSWKDLLSEFMASKIKTFRSMGRSLLRTTVFLYRFVSLRVHPFWIHLAYFVTLSFFGSIALINLTPRSSTSVVRQKYVDMLYMSTAAVTISGLNSVDTEDFSEIQIIVLTFLMFVGGEVVFSLFSLFFMGVNHRLEGDNVVLVVVYANEPSEGGEENMDAEEMGKIVDISSRSSTENVHKDELIRFLGCVVLCYVVAVHVIGFIPVFIYLNVISSARDVLNSKGLRIVTFAVSTVVSSFSNVGILAANENMGAFKTNSGLLLLLIPLILAGNTLYPAFLRLLLHTIRRHISDKRKLQLDFLMTNNPQELDYSHLLPSPEVWFQSTTSLALLTVLSTFFGVMNWNTNVLSGLNPYQKFVGVIFQSVNSRHSGELAFDLSLVSPAVLVLFILLMYLPSYTTFSPFRGEQKDDDDDKKKKKKKKKKKRRRRRRRLDLSQLSYVTIFLIIVCIIERKSISEDPLNFSVLNLIFEVVSAYGNVGLTMGYSCGRQVSKINGEISCVDSSTSFSSRWSDEGKYFLIFVMVFGRLKKYHMGGGTAWSLK